MSAFADALRDMTDRGDLNEDSGQTDAIAALDDLCLRYERAVPTEAGLYLWGKVGRGKSLLMNIFFESVPSPAKRRWHFHAFMQDIHARLQNAQTASRGDRDPLMEVAHDLGGELDLLCLDELEIVDIGDATIVGRLFAGLFDSDVLVVCTSNDHPDDLYRDGPNRRAFVPFIERLKTHLGIVEAAAERDYRSEHSFTDRAYLFPLDDAEREHFERLWSAELTGVREAAAEVETHGRRVRYDRAAGRKVRVRFEDICGRSLSADDHLAFASRFDTVYLEAVPRLDPDRRDEARRLVTLIDALYEARARLVVSADVAPTDLFVNATREEYQRTSSRLQEMTADSWQRRDAHE